jgi:MFS family permease
LVAGVMALEAAALSPLYGWIVDRFGSRLPLIAGSITAAAGFFILSRMDSLLGFYLGFSLAGLGVGAFYNPPMATIANWFQRNRALAMGLALTGFGLSGVLVPVLVWLIELYGWREVLVFAGIGALLICLPLSLVMRHRPAPYGYAPDGDLLPSPDRGHSALEAEATDTASVSGISAGEALRTRSFWLLSVVYCVSFLVWSAVIPHMFLYLGDVGISSEDAALGIAGLMLGSILGRLGGGYLGDRFQKRRVLACCLLLQGLGMLVFAVVSEPWHLAPFLVLLAPSLGATITLLPALFADYFGTRAFALILGLAMVPATLVWFPAPYLAGWVSDEFGSYQPFWLAVAVVTLASIQVVLSCRPPPGRGDLGAEEGDRSSALAGPH